MSEEDWDSGFGRAVAVFLNGKGITDLNSRGEPVVDDSFVICFNAHDEPIDFVVPSAEYANSWAVRLRTETPATTVEPDQVSAGESVTLLGRSIVVLQSVP
jgi:glycogen operon protein